MGEFSDFLNTFGFPIAMCAIEAWYIKYLHDENHSETVKFSDALEANTIALKELSDMVTNLIRATERTNEDGRHKRKERR